MQVFLNLVTNSIRALSKVDRRLISVTAGCEGNRIYVEFSDNGGGVAHPDNLFRPFQAGAETTGLGLFLSRAFMRSFAGELRYQPRVGGACFIVDLIPATASGQDS
jgi:C4-dicarboxylate-specific signal transduction histidine kinase